MLSKKVDWIKNAKYQGRLKSLPSFQTAFSVKNIVSHEVKTFWASTEPYSYAPETNPAWMAEYEVWGRIRQETVSEGL